MLRICSAFVPALVCLIGGLAIAQTALAQTVIGPARVIDGDTLEVAGERVRLYAVDTPENGQTCADNRGRDWDCADWATERLRSAIGGQTVTCAGRDRDRYGRLVAQCSARGRDLGADMVEAGVAVALAKYGRDYVAAEARAREARRGMWAGRFDRPEVYRAQARAVDADAPAGCAIKGNISSNGRIFHQPGQQNYGRTRISEAKGERWFCSPHEARAAGWRPARM